MNGYDFDKTIYDGDSSTDFFVYMILHRPYLLIFSLWYLVVVCLYGMKILSKKKTKECLFFFVPCHKDINKIVEKFWDKNIGKVFDWYKQIQKDDDLIISASLSFVLEPAMKRLGIKNYICTNFDIKTGKVIGENCYGKQKFVSFKVRFPDTKLEAFYSDSLSDLPMLRVAVAAYLVKNKRPEQINLAKIA
jgi:hypothetical protein